MSKKFLMIAFAAFLLCLSFPSARAAGGVETPFQRVIKTNTIRCGYIVYAPYFIKDPKTGEMSGIFHDIMEEIGKNAGLKVEWTEETGYEGIFEGLNAGRFDVFAGGLWPSTARAKAGYFSAPAFYSVITAWVRPEEQRFKKLEDIDDKSVRVAVIDGAMEDIIARTDYPQAQRVSIPQSSPFVLNFQNIVDKKADITFAEPSVVQEFLDKNPAALKNLAPDSPLRIFGNGLVSRLGDPDMKQFLDAGMQELVFGGRIDKILKKYEKKPGLFLRAVLPYKPVE